MSAVLLAVDGCMGSFARQRWVGAAPPNDGAQPPATASEAPLLRVARSALVALGITPPLQTAYEFQEQFIHLSRPLLLNPVASTGKEDISPQVGHGLAEGIVRGAHHGDHWIALT